MSSILLQVVFHLKNPWFDRIGALKGGTFSDFLTSIVAEHQKTEGYPSGNFFSKKSHNAEKTERGPFSFARYCMLRDKKEKNFLVQIARPNGSI